MNPLTDQNGHLANQEDWNEAVANWLAATDEVTLTADHWSVIHAVREIYELTGETPPMRLLIKALRQRLGDEVDSRFLYRLYPDGPVRLASKHAGLPKPKHCM